MSDERPFTLRQIDQARGDLYALQDDLDFIRVQLARLPTRNEVWRAAMLGMLGGAVAAVTPAARIPSAQARGAPAARPVRRRRAAHRGQGLGHPAYPGADSRWVPPPTLFYTRRDASSFVPVASTFPWPAPHSRYPAPAPPFRTVLRLSQPRSDRSARCVRPILVASSKSACR